MPMCLEMPHTLPFLLFAMSATAVPLPEGVEPILDDLDDAEDLRAKAVKAKQGEKWTDLGW